MTELETRLSAALNADTPPARDAMFRVEVLIRLEQARFKRQVARAIVVSALLGIVAAVNAPLIEAGLAAADQHGRVFAFAAAAMMSLVPALLIQSSIRTVVRGVGRWLYF